MNLMDEELNDVKYREITCILNLTKARTTNIIDLPLNLRLINMKIISLSNHAILIAAFDHQPLLFKIMMLSPY